MKYAHPLLSSALLIALAQPAEAKIWVVNAATGSDSTGTGSAASPFRTITRALSIPPQAGDRVYVSGGTYNASLGEVFPLRLPPGVRLEGADVSTTFVAGTAGRPVLELAHDGSYLFDSAVEKLTIRGGQDGIKVFAQRDRRVEPLIRGCTIESNERHGIWVAGTGRAFPAVSASTIRSNGQWGVYVDGRNGPVDVSITGTLLSGNGPGGGLYFDQTSTGSGSVVRESRIVSGKGDGVRLRISGRAGPALINSLIAKNSGAGVLLGITSPEPAGQGDLPIRIVNATISDNSFGLSGAAGSLATAFVTNSIVWGNSDDLAGVPFLVAAWSDLGEPAGGSGVFTADPRFAGRAAGDYRLSAGSPCVDGGTSEAADPEGWAPAVPATDLEGRLRQDDPSVADRGEGTRPWTDVGAYERVPAGNPASFPVTWHVNPATGSDTGGNGSAGSPFRSITRALRAAKHPGNVIRVAAGTCSAATGEVFPIRVPAETQIRGAGRDTTIVQGDRARAVFELSDRAPYTEATVLEKMTIRGGLEGVLVSPLYPASNPTIRECRIEGNVWNGIRAVAGAASGPRGAITGRPKITKNEIRGNGVWGVFIQNNQGSASDRCCMSLYLNGNSITGNGHGGGVYVAGATGINRSRDDRIQKNAGDGLRMTNFSGGHASVVTNPLITGNSGNGVFLYAGPGVPGGDPFHPVLRNATIADNTRDGLHVEGGNVEAFAWNSILWGNGQDVRRVTKSGKGPSIVLQISDVGPSGAPFCGGCISQDPAFLNRASGDYRIAATSPCVDHSRSDTWPFAFFEPTPPPTADLDGKPRFDDPGVENRGFGLLRFWDQGAYEAPVPAGAGLPRTYRVNAASGNDSTGDGSASRPFRTITRALAAPWYPGTVVEVAPGIHDAALGEEFPLEVLPETTVRGAGDGRTVVSFPVTDPPEGYGFVFLAEADYTPATVLEGFTVRGGRTAVSVVPFHGTVVEPTIRGNEFVDNQVAVGASAGFSWKALAAPRLERNTVRGAKEAAVVLEDRSGYSEFEAEGDVSGRLTGNLITGGAIGVRVDHEGRKGAPPITFDGDRITGNSGSALHLITRGSLPLRATLTNVEITKNGWGIYQRHDSYGYPPPGAPPVSLGLVNATVADNPQGGLRVEKHAEAWVRNSVFWGNSDDFLLVPGGCDWSCRPELRLDWSDAGDSVDGYRGAGVFSSSPFFVNRGSGNYHPASGSPLVDAGTSDALSWDTSQPPLPVPFRDLDGVARNDDPSAPNRGGGAMPWIDIGAYERPASSGAALRPPAGEARPDSDGDGVPDGDDCAPADPSAFEFPGPVTGLRLAGGSPAVVTWDPQPGAIYDLASGDLRDLASDGGAARARCLASGLSAPRFEDSRPLAAAAYYVVRARNSCGAGPGGGPGLDRSWPPCP